MDKKTLDALKASIRHWRDVVDTPLYAKVGPHQCALCELFWQPAGPHGWGLLDTSCVKCPVFAHTGLQGCEGTPYGVFERCQSQVCPDEDIARQLATDMLSFLEGLLPAGEVA